MRRSTDDGPMYFDTPAGIVTTSGIRFRTTEPLLEEFAGSVLKHEDLGSLFRRAEVWIRSPVTLALWVLPLLLLAVPFWAALLVSILFLVAWRVVSPVAPSRAGASILGVLEVPAVQGIYYVVVLTLLGWSGATLSVVAGLIGFIVLRFGLVDALLRPVLEPILSRMFALPLPDQILRAVIIRAALRHRVPLPQLRDLERSAREAWKR